MRRAQIVMAVGLLLVAVAMLREALRLPITWTLIGPGSGVFPFWLSVGVAISALLLVVNSVRARAAATGPDQPFIPGRAWKPLTVVFLPIVAVIALLDYLGLYIGGGLYLAGYMWLVGRHRWIAVVLVSVLVPLVLFFIFEKWFLLPMPKGAVLEYLLYER